MPAIGSFRRNVVFSLLNCVTIIIDLFEGLWSAGHVFATSANPRFSTEKLAIFPFSIIVRGGQYDTTHVTFE